MPIVGVVLHQMSDVSGFHGRKRKSTGQDLVVRFRSFCMRELVGFFTHS